jgi:hypothetical protein
MIYGRVYNLLRRVMGRFGRFETHVIDEDLEAAYQQMAEDERRESEALEWAEGTVGDVAI